MFVDALCWVGTAVASHNDRVVRDVQSLEECVQMCHDEIR